MIRTPKSFVGILIMTKVKLSKDSPEELVALLQRRGKINNEGEYSFGWQSYPGVCEITSYGKTEADENIDEALMRETQEELGEKIVKMILEYGKEKIFDKVNEKGERYYIFASLLPKEVFKEIKLDVSTGGIEIVRKTDLKNIKEIYFGKEKIFITDLNNITLWELPISVLEKAFQIFG